MQIIITDYNAIYYRIFGISFDKDEFELGDESKMISPT